MELITISELVKIVVLQALIINYCCNPNFTYATSCSRQAAVKKEILKSILPRPTFTLVDVEMHWTVKKFGKLPETEVEKSD